MMRFAWNVAAQGAPRLCDMALAACGNATAGSRTAGGAVVIPESETRLYLQRRAQLLHELSPRVSLEIQGGWRLTDMMNHLAMISAVSLDSGFCLAEPHIGRPAGMFYTSDSPYAIPMSAITANYTKRGTCLAPAVPAAGPRFLLRPHSTTCMKSGRLGATGWCDAVGGPVCVSVCASLSDEQLLRGHSSSERPSKRPSGYQSWLSKTLTRFDAKAAQRSNPLETCATLGKHRPLGAAILDVAAFIAAQPPSRIGLRDSSSAFAIVLDITKGHSEHIAGANFYPRRAVGQVHPMPSRAMLNVASSYVKGHLGCGVGNEGTTAAMLRVMYDGGRRHQPDEFKAHCKRILGGAQRWVEKIAESATHSTRQRCPLRSFLATDWFVQADGWKSKEHANAIERCWDESNAESNFTWILPSDPRAERVHVSRHAPSLLRPVRPGGPSPFGSEVYRAYLEMAILTQVERCYVSGHLGKEASRLRTMMGKTPCQP